MKQGFRTILGTLLALALATPAVHARPAAPHYTISPPTVVFINEIHYDNSGADVGEAVEIAAPAGTNLTSARLLFYRSDGTVYQTRTLGTSGGTCGGYDLYVVTQTGIQNGAPAGLALVDDATATVVQLLSYEGVFTAVADDATGYTSTDIGVSEPGTTAAGSSLQLGGSGSTYDDLSWQTEQPATFGACNSGQSLTFPPTLVELLSFTAVVEDNGVLLAWETAAEIDNAGFHLYRAPALDGPFVRITETLIASASLEGGGAQYSYLDTQGGDNRFFLLEDVDLAGNSRRHTAIEASRAAGDEPSQRVFLPVVTGL